MLTDENVNLINKLVKRQFCFKNGAFGGYFSKEVPLQQVPVRSYPFLVKKVFQKPPPPTLEKIDF